MVGKGIYVGILLILLFILANEYGLFSPDEDPAKGRWLEQGRTLEYYHLKSGVRQLAYLLYHCLHCDRMCLSIERKPVLFELKHWMVVSRQYWYI